MNICVNPVKPTTRDNAIGAESKRTTFTHTGISKKEAMVEFMKCVNRALMLSASAGKKKMKKGGEK
ncbi:hypothetical protein SR38_19290 [Atlantibacter hermannii]|nr:hypothetical protein SR38_19290 [Atlantibacter hermannii]